jgi:HprK-related kinase A
VADLQADEFRSRIAGPGLGVRLGPFDVKLVVRVPEIVEPLRNLYAWYPVLEDERVFGIHGALSGVLSPRHRPFRRARFAVDGVAPHEDMPRSQALAVLEWGINLVVAMRFHCYLLLHMAVLERHDGALLLPAAPGHGKSTLCAALAHRGWRLLSDEFGVLRPGAARLIPVPRKNESIEVIRRFAPEAVLGPVVAGTRKGDVAHVRPPRVSVERAAETAPPRWLVFPRWRRGAALEMAELPQSEAFMRLTTNAFNYEMHGERGFTTVRDVVAAARCFRLVYSDLDEATAALNRLADEGHG